METSLQTTITNAKKIDTHKEQIELVISRLEGTTNTTKLLKPQTVRTIAEFVDEFKKGLTPWPKLSEEAAHSCYLEREIFLKVLDVAYNPGEHGEKAYELASMFEEKHFLTLAFKWYSYSSSFGNLKATEKIFNIYSANEGITSRVSFDLIRELIFQSVRSESRYFDLERAHYLLSQYYVEESDIEHEKCSKETIERQKNLNSEIEVWDILFRYEFEEEKTANFPSDSSKFLALYEKLSKELKLRISDGMYEFIRRQQLGLICLSVAAFGNFSSDIKKDFWRLFNGNEKYLVSFLNSVESEYGKDCIADIEFALRLLKNGVKQESADYVVKHLYERLDEITEVTFKETFENCHGYRKEQFCNAFLSEYDNDRKIKDFSDCDVNFLFYLFQQCSRYCSEIHKLHPCFFCERMVEDGALVGLIRDLLPLVWNHKNIKGTAILASEYDAIMRSRSLPEDGEYDEEYISFILRETEICDVKKELPYEDDTILLFKELKKLSIPPSFFCNLVKSFDLYNENCRKACLQLIELEIPKVYSAVLESLNLFDEDCKKICLLLIEKGIPEASSTLAEFYYWSGDRNSEPKAAYYLAKAKEQGANIVEVLKEKFEIDISKPKEITEWNKSLLYELEKLGIKFIYPLH